MAPVLEAFKHVFFTFNGNHYPVPPLMLVPKPLQRPYPLSGIAATSERSHVWAGEQGLAVLSHSLYKGWETQAALIDAYQSNWNRDPDGPLAAPRIGMPLFIGIGRTAPEATDCFAEPPKQHAQLPNTRLQTPARFSKTPPN